MTELRCAFKFFCCSTVGSIFDRLQKRSLERARMGAHFRIFRDVIDLERFWSDLGMVLTDIGTILALCLE